MCAYMCVNECVSMCKCDWKRWGCSSTWRATTRTHTCAHNVLGNCAATKLENGKARCKPAHRIARLSVAYVDEVKKPAFVCQTRTLAHKLTCIWIYIYIVRCTLKHSYDIRTRNTFVIPGRKIGAEYTKYSTARHNTIIHRYIYMEWMTRKTKHRKAISSW